MSTKHDYEKNIIVNVISNNDILYVETNTLLICV